MLQLLPSRSRLGTARNAMADAAANNIRRLLEAIALAARSHQGQVRKDGRTPYVSHVFRVCMVLRHVFDTDDCQALLTAALHDTIEDTTTDFDDLEELFGAEVAGWVALLSKDKRLPEPEREKAYVEGLVTAPWQVKLCKLADVFDNLMDCVHSEPHQRARVYQNAHRYLDGLRPHLPEQTRRPWKIVSELLAEMEASETSRSGGA
jgi:guanosine-3',5'-bis(diphosphate) 3'-pyrophosphohydrolase